MNADSLHAEGTGVGVRQPAVLAWMRLMRVFHKVDRIAGEELRPYGLSMAQFDVLAHVGAREGMTQQELADSLLVTKGNICQLLARMERGGLIVRRQEGRANRLYLTDEGRRLFAEVTPRHEREIAGLFGHLSPGQQRELLGLLRRLDQEIG